MSNKEFKVIGDPMDCLAEECAEVIKALMKIKRFGLEGHPGKPIKDGVRVSNRDELLDEMQDCEDRLNEVRVILGASRDSRTLSAVPSDFLHRIFIIMDGDKELERLASADVAIDMLLMHQNGEYPRARIFKMKI